MNGKSIFLLVLLVGVPWFYWSEYRPSEIRSACAKVALEAAQKTYAVKNPSMSKEEASGGMYFKDDFQDSYVVCLNQNGLAS
jgi:hypothetical protein